MRIGEEDQPRADPGEGSGGQDPHPPFHSVFYYDVTYHMSFKLLFAILYLILNAKESVNFRRK
jgi:hypothetical protein